MGMLWKELLPAAARPYGCCNPRLLEAVGCEGEEWAEFLGMTCTYHTEQYHVLIGEGGWDYHNHAVKLTQIHGPAFFNGSMKCWKGYMAAAIVANGVLQYVNWAANKRFEILKFKV